MVLKLLWSVCMIWKRLPLEVRAPAVLPDVAFPASKTRGRQCGCSLGGPCYKLSPPFSAPLSSCISQRNASWEWGPYPPGALKSP